MLKKIIYLIAFFLVVKVSFSQDIPDKPNPPKLVNDYVGILNSEEIQTLERKLVKFNDSTSTQIVVVIVSTLNDLEPADYAQRLGEKWGVGNKGFNNGVVILIRPTGGKNQKKVFIATGYGLEPVITDAVSKQIVENELLPNFRNNNFFKGIDQATTVLMGLANKEFTAKDYQKKHKKSPLVYLIPFIIIAIIFLLMTISAKRKQSMANYNSSGSSLPFWAALMMMGSMGSGRSSNSSNWGNFSGGSGGFSGFGGGSFGGGGAGGSW